MARRAKALLPATLVAAGLGALGAGAAKTQKHFVGRGTVSAPRLTWTANAVPFMFSQGGTSILVDVYRPDGTRLATYAGTHVRVPSRRSIRATELRPNRPNRNAIVVGVTGVSVRKVKAVFAGGASRTVRTVAAPRDWPRANYRLFALSSTLPARYASRRQSATRIDGYNSRGTRISRQRTITTF